MEPTDGTQLSPRQWLDELLDLFPEDAHFRKGDFTIVTHEQVPEPYHDLLVHHHHMTVTLESHHGDPVQLHALKVFNEPPTYARKLRLSVVDPPGSRSQRTVMAGIMRIWLEQMAPQIREAIVEARRPLGRLLIENRVMRTLKTVAFLEVRPSDALRDLFEAPLAVDRLFGRLAMIFCHGEPAIELLEILAPEP